MVWGLGNSHSTGKAMRFRKTDCQGVDKSEKVENNCQIL